MSKSKNNNFERTIKINNGFAQIKELIFNNENMIDNNEAFYTNWPVVYILDGEKEIYISSC